METHRGTGRKLHKVIGVGVGGEKSAEVVRSQLSFKDTVKKASDRVGGTILRAIALIGCSTVTCFSNQVM